MIHNEIAQRQSQMKQIAGEERERKQNQARQERLESEELTIVKNCRA